MNTNGLCRPANARIGFYDYDLMTTRTGGWGKENNGVAVANTDIPASIRPIATYNDMYDGTLAVCSGAVKATATGIMILTTDTVSGETGTYHREWQGWLPALSSDTFAEDAVVYWDATSYSLTTTASGNTKAGIVKRIDGVLTQVVSTAVLGSLPVGTHVHVWVQPIF